MFLTILLYCILHPIHISSCEIEFNEEKEILQITHKIFIDDFEDKLESIYQEKLYLGTQKESLSADKYIESYLKENFSIQDVDGNELTIEWVGKENDIESIWIYQKVEGFDLNKLKIKNTVLFDKFEDQQNIVHFKYKSIKKSNLLNDQKTTWEFSLEE